MPWLSEAKKDVASCEKLRGAASERRTVNVRMGQPTRKGIQQWRQTWGTETSKYLQEKKTKVILRVVASESGTAQTVQQSYTGLKDCEIRR